MMRKHWAAFIGLATLMACESATDPRPTVLVLVSASKSIVSAAAPAVITTTVINVSGRSLNLDTSPCGGPRFIVRNSSGIEIVALTEACIAIKAGKKLLPDEVYSFTSSWDGRDAHGHIVDGEYEVIGTPYGPSGPRSDATRVVVRNSTSD